TGAEAPGFAAVLQEVLRGPPRGQQGRLGDQEGGAGPVVLGVAVQFQAADGALGDLDLLALVLQDVPERGRVGQEALVDAQGGPAVEQEHALQAQPLLPGQVGGVLGADLLEPAEGGLEDLPDGLALLPAVGLAGAAAEVALEQGHLGGLGVRLAVLAGAAAQHRAHVGRLLPAARVLADHVQAVVQALREDGPRPFHDQLLTIHVDTLLWQLAALPFRVWRSPPGNATSGNATRSFGRLAAKRESFGAMGGGKEARTARRPATLPGPGWTAPGHPAL